MDFWSKRFVSPKPELQLLPLCYWRRETPAAIGRSRALGVPMIQWTAAIKHARRLFVRPLYTSIRPISSQVSDHFRTPADLDKTLIYIPTKPIARPPSILQSSTMVLPHHTPYVTPHILHKNYAQAFDNESHSNRTYISSSFLTSCSHWGPQSSARTSSTSRRQALTWIGSK